MEDSCVTRPAPATPGSRDTSPDAPTLPTLAVHRDWDGLCDHAVDLLTARRDDPFRRPLLVTPSPAHSRCLAQAVARRSGIAAGLAGTTPGALRRGLDRDLLGLDPRSDPWHGEALVLRVRSILDERIDEPWLETVRLHLAATRDAGVPHPAWTTARRAAEGLTALVDQAPDVLRRWAREETSPDDLDAARAWWAPLWRALVGTTDVPDPLSRLDLLADALAGRPTMPWDECVWLAGPRAGLTEVTLARSLAAAVTTTVLHLDHTGPQCDGRPDPDPWAPFDRVRSASTRTWRDHTVADPTTRPDTGGALLVAPEVEIHLCHGPDRQAEVVCDAVLAALQDHPDLEPRDVVVCCPTPGDQADLVAAMTHPDPDTSVRPATGVRLSAAATEVRPNPVAEAVVAVLDLPRGRATAADLVDLCAMPAVATRFGFDADSLDLVARLVGDAEIRWGIDSSWRAREGLAGVRQSTWWAGIERMLLGIAMPDRPPTHLGTVTPVSDVESTAVAVVGRLAEFVSRVRRALLLSRDPAPLGQWSTTVATLVSDLTAAPPDQAWATPATLGILSGLAPWSGERLLTREEVSALLRQRASRRRRRPTWFTGSAQICTPADLDAIAHEVVVLVDPDRARGGADPLRGLREPADVGTDPAAVDRQYLVDAVAAARRRLVVVRQARDPVTNAAVLAGPFSACLEAALAAQGRDPAHSEVHHGLQPFSASEFAVEGWRGFDRAAARAAAAAASPTPADHADHAEEMLPAPQTAPRTDYSPTDVGLALLHPARTLLRARMVAPAQGRDEELVEDLPISLPPLAAFGVRDRLLTDLRRGADPQAALVAERLRGTTPPGALGTTALEGELLEARRIAERARAAGSGPRRMLDVDLTLTGDQAAPLSWPPGVLVADEPLHLTGRIEAFGNTVVLATAGRANARPVLMTWLDLLALCAAHPRDDGWTGVVVARGAQVSLLGPPPETALSLLSGLARTAWWANQQLVPVPAAALGVLAGVISSRSRRHGPSSGAAWQRWSQDHDANWAPFVEDTEAGLRRRCEALATTPEDLAQWLWGPVRTAMTARRP